MLSLRFFISLLFVPLVWSALVLNQASRSTLSARITCDGDQQYNYAAYNDMGSPNRVFRVLKSTLQEVDPIYLQRSPQALVYDDQHKVLLVVEDSSEQYEVQVVDTQSWTIRANITVNPGTSWGAVRYNSTTRTLTATSTFIYDSPVSLDLYTVTFNANFTNATSALVSCSSASRSLDAYLYEQQQQVVLKPNASYFAGYNIDYGSLTTFEIVKVNLDGSVSSFRQFPSDTVSVLGIFSPDNTEDTLLFAVVKNLTQITLQQLDPNTLNALRSIDVTQMVYPGATNHYYFNIAYNNEHNTLFFISPTIGQLDLNSFTIVATLNISNYLPKGAYELFGTDSDWNTQTLFVLTYSQQTYAPYWLKIGVSFDSVKVTAVVTSPTEAQSEAIPYWLVSGGAYETGFYGQVELIDPTGSWYRVYDLNHYVATPAYSSNALVIGSTFYTAIYQQYKPYLIKYSAHQLQLNATDLVSSLAYDDLTEETYALLPWSRGVFKYDLESATAGDEIIYNNTLFQTGDQIAVDSAAGFLYATFTNSTDEEFFIAQVDLKSLETVGVFKGPGPITQMISLPDGQLIAVFQASRPYAFSNGVFEIVSIKFGVDDTYDVACFTNPCSFNSSDLMIAMDSANNNLIGVPVGSGYLNGYQFWRYSVKTFDMVTRNLIQDVYAHVNMYTQLLGLGVLPYFNLCSP